MKNNFSVMNTLSKSFITSWKSQPSTTLWNFRILLKSWSQKAHKTLGFFFLRNNQNGKTNQPVILLHWKWGIFQMPLLHDGRYCEPRDMNNPSELFNQSFFSGFCYQRMMLTNIDRCVINSKGDKFIPMNSIIGKSFVNSREYTIIYTSASGGWWY